MNLTCVIIDDEYRGREVLSSLVKTHCPELTILATANDVMSGYETINRFKPDIVFLDIEMPDGTGFDLLQRFEQPAFKTVIVTSYDRYAIQAVKSHAFDYLLKPVIVNELKAMVSNFLTLRRNNGRGTVQRCTVLEINHKTKLEYLRSDDIFWLKGDGNYTRIYATEGRTYHTSRILREYEGQLCVPGSGFVRAHKSAIINLRFVKSFEHGTSQGLVLMNGAVVEVSRRRKEDVLNELRDYRATQSSTQT